MSKSVLPPIPNRYLAEGEPGSGGLWRLDAEERVARQARLSRKPIFYLLARRAHFDKKLQDDQWVAFGRSPKLGKRVPIDSPWRSELLFDDQGHMWDGGERFTEVQFYPVTDPAESRVEVGASSSAEKAEQPGAKPGGGKPGSGKRGGYYSTPEILRGVELARSGLGNTRAAEVLFEQLHPKPVEREQLHIWIDEQRRYVRRMRKKIGDAIKAARPS